MHGAGDTVVSVEHSRHMEAALHTAGIEVIYAEFPRMGHGDLFSWDLTGSLILAFVDRHLKSATV
jgi:dipeptidyl aminopeptidase/acylaminoacyl peptidase